MKRQDIKGCIEKKTINIYNFNCGIFFFQEYKAEKEEEMKAKLAESGRHKSYRRYMKKNGVGRMYFDD